MFGSLFYVYFYYWAFAAVFLIFISALYFLTRDRARALAALYTFIGGAVLAVPYAIKTILFRQNEFYVEISKRVGLEISRAFRTSSLDNFIFLFLLAVFGWFLAKKRGVKQVGVIFVALFLTVVAVLNLQVVTGFNIQPDHWGSRVNVYILAFMLFVVICWTLEKFYANYFLLRTLVSLVIVFFASLGVIFQIQSSAILANKYKIPEDNLIAWRWIDKNLPRDSMFVFPS